MNDLVQRLTKEQPIVVSLRPEPNLAAFKAALDRRYVHVLFTETRGGTELGVRVAPEDYDVSDADLEQGTGEVRIAGDLTLDYVRVRCHAKIDVATLKGTGWLVPLEEAEAAEPAPAAAGGDEAH
ncbi:MAG TPA: MbtH domain protein [Thermoanaerobaculia bacterium]|jgi:hypothetical protein